MSFASSVCIRHRLQALASWPVRYKGRWLRATRVGIFRMIKAQSNEVPAFRETHLVREVT